MARSLYRLTEKVVRHLTKPGHHADGGGLYLQISKAGTKSWIFRFTINGRTRDMGLGSAFTVSLNEARARASEARSLTARRVDPIEQAKADEEPESSKEGVQEDVPPSGPTFEQFAEEYIRARAHQWRSAKHGDQWRSTLTAYAYPIIGNMPLAEIETSDILRILEPIWSSKSETASRVRGRIERILAAASVRDLRPPTNPAAWKGHLQEALPAKRKSKPFAALSYGEVPAFLAVLRPREGVSPRALEFTILTAARSGEVRGTTWAEIDESASLWTVPGERMKAGRPHLVPLTERALEILEEMKPLRDLAGGFVFPGTKIDRPLSDMTLSKLVRSMGLDSTVHGFRSCFKTWAEEETHHAHNVIEASLAHIVGDRVERVYFRGDRLAKRRALMDDWAAHCTSKPTDSIVPFRAAKRTISA